MSVHTAVDDFLEMLTVDSPEVSVLAAMARTLADEIDNTEKSAAGAVRELRAVIDELAVKGRTHGGNDGTVEGTQGWASITTLTGAAEVRDAKKSAARNARPAGRGGRKTAG